MEHNTSTLHLPGSLVTKLLKRFPDRAQRDAAINDRLIKIARNPTLLFAGGFFELPHGYGRYSQQTNCTPFEYTRTDDPLLSTPQIIHDDTYLNDGPFWKNAANTLRTTKASIIGRTICDLLGENPLDHDFKQINPLTVLLNEEESQRRIQVFCGDGASEIDWATLRAGEPKSKPIPIPKPIPKPIPRSKPDSSSKHRGVVNGESARNLVAQRIPSRELEESRDRAVFRNEFKKATEPETLIPFRANDLHLFEESLPPSHPLRTARGIEKANLLDRLTVKPGNKER